MQTDLLSLSEVYLCLQKHKRHLFLYSFICWIGFITAVFLATPYYYSKSVTIAANPALTDKARLFNSNIEGLYSNFGSSDDAERLLGIARLDTCYRTLCREFKLVDYYKIKQADSNLALRKAVIKLKADLTVQKNELNQLVFEAYAQTPGLAAQLVNKHTQLVSFFADRIWKNQYQQLQASVQLAIQQMMHLNDSLPQMRAAEQLQKYQQLSAELSLALASNTEALLVLEWGYPSAKADKPKKLLLVCSGFFISILVGCFITLVRYRKKMP
jgi:hypothetical protein